ncbi:hypothetical protein Syun_013379 [Stephania yunnanensis]|uniref:RING-type E3 ubiquitin transferase n=1 Tax=Stephania yunnanensis TaxID=152371 RepID=A0AAP0PIJ3_9MAGN
MPKEEMHSVFITSSLLLAILLAVTTKGEDHFDDASAETRCGDDGPPIRFPFSLIKLQQQDHHHHHPNVTSSSGYPGFELSCTDQYHTLLQLPHGGKFRVTQIDYAFQELIVSDPDGCIVPRLLHLNLSSSPFLGYQDTLVMKDYSIHKYTFFNCSSTNKEILNESTPIECLSVPGRYNIFAIDSYYYKFENEPFTYCTVGKTIPLPDDLDFDWRKGQAKFSWFSPKCGHCEKQGQRCRFKKKKSTGSPDDDHDNNDHDHYDTECFFIPKSHAKEGETENLSIPPNPFASTTTPEKNTRNIQQRPRDHHALSIISEHDELE